MNIATAARVWLTRSFKPFDFKNEYDNQILYENTENLGLYIHIPFCRSICSFCPYCKTVYDEELARCYTDALIKEIELVGESVLGKKEVTSLYFGGGSPALLANKLYEIIATINKYFIIKEGIGLELHPDDVTVELLNNIKSAGVSKISIGIQSFRREQLSALGRKEPDYRTLFYALKEVSFETVSFDLIFAIPGQTAESLKQDISYAFENGANHIAIYPFIDFSFSDSNIPPMTKNEKRRLLDSITDYCTSRGYVRTSIWTFAKQSAKKYSSMTRDNFLGFGCSATTLLRDRFKINTFSIKDYIDRVDQKQLPTSLTLRFTLRQRMIYYLFWTAYTTRVDPKAFERFFGASLYNKYGFELFISRILGFVKKKDGIYHMSAKGAYYYHYFEQFYTLAYIEKMWGIMRNEAFPDRITF
ncbi:MAG: radical SAM protein [Clostridiaceae bacterium]|nr:radical SAM protein [Clostridiaceae bacterium]